MISKKDDYNNVPVEYCKKCLDLRILEITHPTTHKNAPYCGICGSAEIGKAHIKEFNKKHTELYGEDYLTRNK